MGGSASPHELQKLKFNLTDLVPTASIVACFTTLIIYENRQSNIESLLKRPKTPSSSKSSSNWRRFVRRSRIISTTGEQVDSQLEGE